MSRKLTKDFIRSRLGNDDFENIKNLNLWGNNIDDISLLSEMPKLEIISLSTNHIKDLSVFRKLKNIKELYLIDNQISDFNQIENLKNCPKLEILCLQENPISKQSNYHQKIFEILPFLKKLDNFENNNINKNSPPSRLSLPKSSFILFKKIFPKRTDKLFKNKINDLNTSENEQINNNLKESKNNNNSKGDLLNKSFQKKKTIGTFRKLGNKKNAINLDLSVDYANNNILGNNNEIIDSNRSSIYNNYKSHNTEMYFGRNKNEIIDSNRSSIYNNYKSHNTEMYFGRNKYNKKVVGNFKKDHIKNYQSTLLTYQEFDAPIKKEENNKNLNDNNKNDNKNDNINNIIDNKNIKTNKNENTVLESIRILLDTLNLSELKIVNDDIKKIIKEKDDKNK